MRVLLIVLTLALAALLMPSPASAHVHAPAPASQQVDRDAATHPCEAPAERQQRPAGACVCPAICVPALAGDVAAPPAPKRTAAWTATAPARDGVERLPPVPPPRG